MLGVGPGEAEERERLAVSLIVHERAEGGLEPREAVVRV